MQPLTHSSHASPECIGHSLVPHASFALVKILTSEAQSAVQVHLAAWQGAKVCVHG